MNDKINEPVIEKRLLNPIERISEILFGLIMALTFTCTISVIQADRAEVKDMLIGAIGCNIAWGLVDAVMYVLMTLTEKGRGLMIFNFVRNTDDLKKAHQFITASLPEVISTQMQTEDIEVLRKKIVQMPNPPTVTKLQFKDYKMAAGIFILVFLSTFPVVIPFIFIKDLQSALRVSNLVAITMMFLCGWFLAQYAGRNRFFTGIILSLIGISLVLITISLGG